MRQDRTAIGRSCFEVAEGGGRSSRWPEPRTPEVRSGTATLAERCSAGPTRTHDGIVSMLVTHYCATTGEIHTGIPMTVTSTRSAPAGSSYAGGITVAEFTQSCAGTVDKRLVRPTVHRIRPSTLAETGLRTPSRSLNSDRRPRARFRTYGDGAGVAVGAGPKALATHAEQHPRIAASTATCGGGATRVHPCRGGWLGTSRSRQGTDARSRQRRGAEVPRTTSWGGMRVR